MPFLSYFSVLENIVIFHENAIYYFNMLWVHMLLLFFDDSENKYFLHFSHKQKLSGVTPNF